MTTDTGAHPRIRSYVLRAGIGRHAYLVPVMRPLVGELGLA